MDLATLTGAILIALGHTYAGLFSNDDDWCGEVDAACDATGEIGWRMPLHPEYLELTKGQYADLTNAAEQRVAMSNYAAEFLRQFVDEHALGAHRHRRHRVGNDPQLRGQGRQRLRHPHADRAGSPQQRLRAASASGYTSPVLTCDEHGVRRLTS